MKAKPGSAVVVLGASDDPERYSYKAFHKLIDHGFHALGVNPRLNVLEGHPCYPSLTAVAEVEGEIDTVSVYVRPAISGTLGEELSAIRPRRIVFNPGSENPALQDALAKSGIEVVTACTLVMLRTNQF